MKILFDLRNVGLGDNGGSATLVNSSNMLQKLGCDVKIIDNGKNKHTWNKLEVPHVIVENASQIPDADFIIATGYKSVLTTLKSLPRCGKKCIWIRGWEIWQVDEQWIYNNILKQPIIKFVNSLGLQNKLKKYNVDSVIVYPGYDYNLFYNLPSQKKDYIVLGGLYNKKHSAIKRITWLFDTYNQLKKQNIPVKLYLLGNDDPPKNYKYDKYIQRPSMEEKNRFYNDIDIWLSTTMLDGNHLPPAEAMMTNCPVVTTCAELSGTHDYVVNGVTGVVTEDNFESFINGVKTLCTNEKFRLSLGMNCWNKIVEIGSREENMKKFIKILEGYK